MKKYVRKEKRTRPVRATITMPKLVVECYDKMNELVGDIHQSKIEHTPRFTLRYIEDGEVKISHCATMQCAKRLAFIMVNATQFVPPGGKLKRLVRRKKKVFFGFPPIAVYNPSGVRAWT